MNTAPSLSIFVTGRQEKGRTYFTFKECKNYEKDNFESCSRYYCGRFSRNSSCICSRYKTCSCKNNSKICSSKTGGRTGCYSSTGTFCTGNFCFKIW